MTSWLSSTRRRRAYRFERCQRGGDRASHRVGVPRLEEQREVEGEVQFVVPRVRRHARRVGERHLADEDPLAGVIVDEAAATGGRAGEPQADRSRCASRSRSEPPGSSGSSRSGVSLNRPWATSMRNPSTPRSSQKRRIPRSRPGRAARASRGRAAPAHTGAGSTRRSRGPASTPAAKRGGPVVRRSAVAPRPEDVAQAVRMLGRRERIRNHGCALDV